MPKNILICGGAGTLGSGLSSILVKEHNNVSVLDIIRSDEAWKLEDAGVKDKVEYIWKSTTDINESDLKDIDIVIDCGLAVPDRPMGTNSPIHSLIGNLLPPMYLLETVRKMKKKPMLIYPSSLNARYGHKVNSLLNEATFPLPSTPYGWTKSAAEMLYLTYNKSFGVPVVIVVVGSGYGPRMRSDELIGNYILKTIRGEKKFKMRSPKAKRLWSFAADFLAFYKELIYKVDDFNGAVLSCAGNKGDKIVTNIELASIINKVARDKGFKPLDVEEANYEPGELINGEPINFDMDNSKTRSDLHWTPSFTLEDGISTTFDWFSKNIHRFAKV
jgi:dTDP-glucose 4,6-dehydratase